MTSAGTQDAEQDVLRWRELASLGAQRAAQALSTLAGARVEVGALRADDAQKAPAGETGILFELAGRLAGRLGLFVDAPTRRSLVRLLLDEDEPEAPAEMVESALCELANIVASQTVSAIADALGAAVTLSVPQLVHERAGAAFVAAREGGAGVRAFASELASSHAELRVLLVLAPDA